MTARARSYERGLAGLAAPFAVGVVALVLVPAAVTIAFAFTDFDGVSPARYAGLETFRRLFRDPELWQSLRATAIFLLLAAPIRLLGGLALALLADGRGRVASATRLAVYTPAVIPDPAVALVWLWIINPLYGPAAGILGWFGGRLGPVLLEPWGSRATIAALSVFALGEGFLVTLAARREIPQTLYDAARVEGARAWRRFHAITWPLLAPTLGLLLARDVLMSLQTALVPTLLLTAGGPLGATKTLPVFVYERGFAESRLGDAAALAVLLMVGALCLVLLAVAARALLRRARRRPAPLAGSRSFL